jgi:glycosyltransferase involved in cell wall biosynthesis
VLRVAAYTGGRNVPSARFRVRQYIQPLLRAGIRLNEYCSPLGTYPPRHRFVRPAWGLGSLLARLPGIIASHSCDLTVLQREMLSTFCSIEGLTSHPRVLDVDDAIWCYRGGHFAARLARACDAVICGNTYLAGHFAQWNPRVFVVPTPVDTARFRPISRQPGRKIIGWSGTSGGFAYLAEIEPALKKILKKHPEAVLRIISDRLPTFKTLRAEQIEFRLWNPIEEVADISDITVGIMPLDDSEWSRGKCSYKMLTYMAVGVPVVSSDIGMNSEIFRLGNCGLPARSIDDWASAMDHLLSDPGTAQSMGVVGRGIAETHFSVTAVAPLLGSVFRAIAESRGKGNSDDHVD